ncbi:MAG: HIT family protein [Planctomycetota bacterium]|nr:HIT family protein [Planctomycetota bacterium]
MASCVFCRIVAGELPSARIYEDDKTVAFLDINPIVRGHALVLTRDHYEGVDDIPEQLLRELAASVKKVARSVKQGMNAEGVNILLNNGRCSGQIVPHIHFHVIPRSTNDGVAFQWSPRQYSSSELDEVAARIRKAHGA